MNAYHQRCPIESAITSGVVGIIGVMWDRGGQGTGRIDSRNGRWRRRGAKRHGPGAVVVLVGRIVEAAAGEGETTAAVSGEQASVTDPVKAARRDQGAQAQEQILRFKAQDVAAVAEATFHLVEDGAIGGAGESTLGQRRAQAVAAEPLEAGAVVVVDGDACVKREAVVASA